MNNFWVDPFGFNLIQKSEEQTIAPDKKEEMVAPAPQYLIYNGFYPYYCSPMPMACQIIHVHRSYCHQLQLPAPVLAPVPAPAPAPAPPPKEKCKTCSEYKCKACKNAEEMNKVVVTKTSFWNPRQHSKGIVRE